MNNLPNIWLFWTGEKEYGKGGSGIEEILKAFWSFDIKDCVNVIVSSNRNGWVRKIAYENWIPFKAMTKLPSRLENWEYSEEDKEELKNRYLDIVKEYDLEYIFLSGWLVYVIWLEPNKTVNIHPGPLNEPYGWKGMYGMNIHNKVWEDYVDWKINQTCITMNYVTENIDDGPIIAQIPVWLVWCNSPEDVQKRVKQVEHIIQWKITQMVITWEISWSWIKWDSVQFPENFTWGKEVDLMDWVAFKK